MNKTVEELHELLVKGEVTSEELVKEALEKSKEVQDKYNAFVTILDDVNGCDVTDSLLSGIPFGLKDNFSTKGILSTGSSNTLKDYVPFFNATAYDNLLKNGAVLVNKTAMDEFGMGGTGTTCHTGVVLNPWDRTRMCAGSSSGSACAVAAGVYPYATGTDTGDSIRKPAAYCGIVGYKPTYGMISRYGVFPFASSMDHLGALTRSVKDAAIVVDAMKGIDDKDMTSWDSKDIHLYDSINGEVKGKKLCYIKEICDISNYPNASDELKAHLENFNKTIELCKNIGMDVEEVSIDKTLLNAIASTYVVISCAEATSNMSNLTGLIFGPRGEGRNYIEMMKDYRTKNFSPLIKRRFVIGSYVLQAENKDRYFNNA
ncbi:MAG: Asp-tRNA(Asn)/Glu-tRNA(Gln) amidotransferase subunit GatA, partial [Bacilli bacterium]|nr:Asp-tRNA(Asn)/Glu-tRNA(Gln) amidotransferase subunit GatA [Bacilli bacterium]